jgi:hypothetical protein
VQPYLSIIQRKLIRIAALNHHTEFRPIKETLRFSRALSLIFVLMEVDEIAAAGCVDVALAL